MPATLHLQPEREKSVLRRHPWIFSKGIARVEGKAAIGETVAVRAADGRFLGWAAYSPESQIRARIWSLDEQAVIDQAFFEQKLRQADALRQHLLLRQQTTGYRLVAAESDGLPGITIDRYGPYLVLQLLSAGAEYHRQTLVAALQMLYPDCLIYERSDADVRHKEGLKPVKGPLVGAAPAAPVAIDELGLKLLVDIENGHKTGFYLDQRDNRAIAADYCTGGRVLNCFSYTGGFGLAALRGGASEVVNVDASEGALELARHSLALNPQLDASRAQFLKADVFKLLRWYRERGEQFDTIILDPPKFADSKAQLMGACRGYKDINMLAMQLLKPGGTLLTFSCSGLMPSDLFQKIVADAALDAGRDAQILRFLRQSEDHPVAIHYPEGLYLKGLVLRVL
ncbi:MAG: class I SAM-dependent methyltransferase [Gammaproteobacteria bacterium]|nr:class I SAM-dependent methyltransferase [Gammaproteobacteria bacterium]